MKVMGAVTGSAPVPVGMGRPERGSRSGVKTTSLDHEYSRECDRPVLCDLQNLMCVLPSDVVFQLCSMDGRDYRGRLCGSHRVVHIPRSKLTGLLFNQPPDCLPRPDEWGLE